MNKHNNTEKTWWERNKKKVIIICGVVVTVGAGFIVFKNKDALITLMKKSKAVANNAHETDIQSIIEKFPEINSVINTETIIQNTRINNGLPFEVNGFVRMLPDNRHASPEKLEQARSLGITLGEHQTWVNTYIKNAA